jgi:hypothetical protein
MAGTLLEAFPNICKKETTKTGSSCPNGSDICLYMSATTTKMKKKHRVSVPCQRPITCSSYAGQITSTTINGSFKGKIDTLHFPWCLHGRVEGRNCMSHFYGCISHCILETWMWSNGPITKLFPCTNMSKVSCVSIGIVDCTTFHVVPIVYLVSLGTLLLDERARHTPNYKYNAITRTVKEM